MVPHSCFALAERTLRIIIVMAQGPLSAPPQGRNRHDQAGTYHSCEMSLDLFLTGDFITNPPQLCMCPIIPPPLV